MSKRKDDGKEAAFPAVHAATGHNDVRYMSTSYGMTLRQYAAIKLRVPDSGTDWLDDMIRQSLRDDFASKVVQGIYSTAIGDPNRVPITEDAYLQADAMLEARDKP